MKHDLVQALACTLAMFFSLAASAARWNAETIDWSRNPRPVIGDWGFDRPGYPKGLYIHGITVKEGKAVRNAVIYDNDVYNDVLDDEWMFAMASLGRMRLVGQIVTPLYSEKWQFYWPWWVHTAFTAMERARASGIDMRRLPPVTVGTEAETEREAEGKSSDGARLYVELINKEHKKTPGLPVIVNIGGQAATLASAWCLDPSIADKCIVYYTDIETYNGDFRWASNLVAEHFRVVDFGSDRATWGSRLRQNEWTVLPRPEHAEAAENDAWSGEWRRLSEKHVPLLDWFVHQLRHRKELSQVGWKADGYCDGTFMHAWLPGMFSGAALTGVRNGEVLRITRFGSENEALVKQFALGVLLDARAYWRIPESRARRACFLPRLSSAARKLQRSWERMSVAERDRQMRVFAFDMARPIDREAIQNCHRQGFLPVLEWHWGGDVNLGCLLDEGSRDHRALWTELRCAALELAPMREAGIPVLWRPLADIDHPSATELWRTMYDYFTLTHALDNLLWLSPDGCYVPQNPPAYLIGGFF